MRYQLELSVDAAMKRFQEPEASPLAKKLHMTADHLRDLREGRWTEITRAELQRLTTWVRSCGGNESELFKLVEHPIWATFADSTAEVYDGTGPANSVLEFDEKAFSVMTSFLKVDGCQVLPHTNRLPSSPEERTARIDQVTKLMQTRNCIFIGGPRQSPATEVAVANLWKAQPFTSGPNAIPFQFVYEALPEGLQSCFARVDSPEKRGIELKSAKRGVIELRNPFMPKAQWEKCAGRRWDFAIVVVCHRPLETKENVTTVVIAGLTGLATYAAALELMKETLYLDGNDIRPSWPRYRVLCARYKKSGADGRSLPRAGSKWVGPPWMKWPPGLFPKTDAADDEETY